MPFSASAIFCFTFSISAKSFPLRTSCIQGNKKKVNQGEIRWVYPYVYSGAQGACHFCLRTAEHSAWHGQVSSWVTHHEMGQHIERVFKKNSLKPLITMPAGRLIQRAPGMLTWLGKPVLQGAWPLEDNPSLGGIPPHTSFSPSPWMYFYLLLIHWVISIGIILLNANYEINPFLRLVLQPRFLFVTTLTDW